MNIAKILALPEVQQLTAMSENLEDIFARIQAEKFNPDFEVIFRPRDGKPDIIFTTDPTGNDPALDKCYRDFLDQMCNFVKHKQDEASRKIKQIIAEKS